MALLAAIDRYLGDRVEVSGANAGLHVLLWLHHGSSRQQHILRRIEAAGVRVYPVTPFYLSPPTRLGFLVGCASLTESEITEGVRRLATAV